MRQITPLEWILGLLTAAVISLAIENYRQARTAVDLRERVAGLEEGLKSWTSGPAIFRSTNYTVIEPEPHP